MHCRSVRSTSIPTPRKVMASRMVVIPEKVYEYLTTRVSDSAYRKHQKADEPSPTVRQKRHRDAGAFTCATCERQLSSRRRLREHSLIHEAYECRPYTRATSSAESAIRIRNPHPHSALDVAGFRRPLSSGHLSDTFRTVRRVSGECGVRLRMSDVATSVRIRFRMRKLVSDRCSHIESASGIHNVRRSHYRSQRVVVGFAPWFHTNSPDK